MTPEVWACVTWCVLAWAIGVAPVWVLAWRRLRDPMLLRGAELTRWADWLYGCQRRRYRWLGVTWWSESDRSLRRRCRDAIGVKP